MSQDQDKYVVRLPDGLRDEIKAAAMANGRSMNAEIVHRLSSENTSLRDQFAAAALTGLLANSRTGSTGGEDSLTGLVKDVARLSYVAADAMLKARQP